MPLTANNLVIAINSLPRTREYNYINSSNPVRIILGEVTVPEGPITIYRYNPNKGEARIRAKKATISTEMLWRVANAISENYPINVDRVLGASYNTRSVLESLLAHTPQFYWCLPGRIEVINSYNEIKRGHKHLIFKPNEPHEIGVLTESETDIVISEIPSREIIYDALILPEAEPNLEIDIDLQRRHAQIQLALLFIGIELGSRVWVAQNDRGITYQGTIISNIEGVIPRLTDLQLLSNYGEAIRAATMIDLIWFRNSRFMPAVFEIEHSTGVTSGLTRMKNFYDRIPLIQSRWVVVATDELREQVIRIANQPQFRDLNTKFMPYSSVEELYSLCQRRKIRGVTDEFLDCFMEPCLTN